MAGSSAAVQLARSGYQDWLTEAADYERYAALASLGDTTSAAGALRGADTARTDAAAAVAKLAGLVPGDR